jgi:anti-sigma regulatory factor (Ser/Thr protein kinase)
LAETIRLAFGLNAPADARAWMQDICAIHGADMLADDATLIVSELVTNVVLHARTDCVIVAEFGDHAMRVDVVDEDHSLVRALAVADGSEGQRGLHLVAALATTWGVRYQQQGKTVWFTLKSATDGHPPPLVEDATKTVPRSTALV